MAADLLSLKLSSIKHRLAWLHVLQSYEDDREHGGIFFGGAAASQPSPGPCQPFCRTPQGKRDHFHSRITHAMLFCCLRCKSAVLHLSLGLVIMRKEKIGKLFLVQYMTGSSRNEKNLERILLGITA